MLNVSPSGGWICSNQSQYDGFGSISCFVFVPGIILGVILVDLGVLGRHFGRNKWMHFLIEKPGRG